MVHEVKLAVTLSGIPEDITAEAQAAEEGGFDAVAVGEHLFFHGPTSNAFVALAAAAAVTRRIRLLSAMTLLPLYPAALAVKLATTIDRISAGRFDWGVGVGGENPDEFIAAGVDLKLRGKRTDEALEVARRLWSDDVVNFVGTHNHIPGLRLDPGPVQPGGPPLWIGGRSEAAIRRAGRYANTWLPHFFTPAQFASSLDGVRQEAERANRDPMAVAGAIYVWGSVSADGAQARLNATRGVSEIYRQDFSELADRYLVAGTAEQVTERLNGFREAGADTVVFAPVPGPHRPETVAQLSGRVIPALKGC